MAGTFVLGVLRELGCPSTAEEIIAHAASKLALNTDELSDMITETLAGGLVLGYLLKDGDKFTIPQVADLDVVIPEENGYGSEFDELGGNTE